MHLLKPSVVFITLLVLAPPIASAGQQNGQAHGAPVPPEPAAATQPVPAPAAPVTAADLVAARTARLDVAKRVLDSVGANGSRLKGDAASRVAAVRRDFSDLVMAYWASRNPPSSADLAANPASSDRSDQSKAIPAWREKFSDIERGLSYLISGGAATRTGGTVGTSGAAGANHATDDVTDRSELGPDNVARLDEFRRDLELFYVETLDDTVAAPPQAGVGLR